jgi:hypothetical protein
VTDCPRHPRIPAGGCYFCKTGTEPGDPFVPPSQAELDQAVDGAIIEGLRVAAEFDEGALDGIGAMLAVQFPDIPCAVLGRIVLSAAMAAGSYVRAMAELGQRVPAAMAVDLLAAAGARMAREQVPDAPQA